MFLATANLKILNTLNLSQSSEPKFRWVYSAFIIACSKALIFVMSKLYSHLVSLMPFSLFQFLN